MKHLFLLTAYAEARRYLNGDDQPFPTRRKQLTSNDKNLAAATGT